MLGAATQKRVRVREQDLNEASGAADASRVREPRRGRA
jgi:hypothetical protein